MQTNPVGAAVSHVSVTAHAPVVWLVNVPAMMPPVCVFAPHAPLIVGFVPVDSSKPASTIAPGRPGVPALAPPAPGVIVTLPPLPPLRVPVALPVYAPPAPALRLRAPPAPAFFVSVLLLPAFAPPAPAAMLKAAPAPELTVWPPKPPEYAPPGPAAIVTAPPAPALPRFWSACPVPAVTVIAPPTAVPPFVATPFWEPPRIDSVEIVVDAPVDVELPVLIVTVAVVAPLIDVSAEASVTAPPEPAPVFCWPPVSVRAPAALDPVCGPPEMMTAPPVAELDVPPIMLIAPPAPPVPPPIPPVRLIAPPTDEFPPVPPVSPIAPPVPTPVDVCMPFPAVIVTAPPRAPPLVLFAALPAVIVTAPPAAALVDDDPAVALLAAMATALPMTVDEATVGARASRVRALF